MRPSRLFLAVLALLTLPALAWAQGSGTNIRGIAKGATPAGTATVTSVDANHTGIDVNIVGGGGSGGTASNFGAAFPATGTAAGFIGSTGNMAGGNLDSGGRLIVNCGSGCAGAAGDGTASGSLGAVNNTVVIALSTYLGANVDFTSGGNLVGTVVAEGSNDGGATYPFSVWFLHPATGALSASLSNPTVGDFSFAWTGSISHVRVRVSAYTSGATTANLRTTATNTLSVMVGSDGTNLRVMSLTSTGLVKVDLSGTGANATAIKVDGSAVTQPISGSVGQSGAPWTQDLTRLAGTTLAGPFDVDSGGGTQSVLGVSMRKAASGGSVEYGTSSDPLRVDPTGTTTQPVSGTVTSNQGGAPWTVKPDATVWTLTGTSANTNVTNFPITATTNAISVRCVDTTGSSFEACGGAGGSGGTQYDQGTATTATDKLTMAGAVRHDTATVDAGVADGDRVVLSTDAAGRLRMTAVDTTQPISAASLPLPTGAATEATLGNVLTTSAFQARINTLGQKTMANSTPMVIASDQSAVPASQSGTWNITNISGTISLPTGAATDRTTAGGPSSVRLSDGSAFYDATKTGQLPSALVGGRLDENVGAWLGSTAPTVGSKTSANSLPVVIASDQGAVPVSGTVTTTPPANASTNVAQFGGTNVSTGTGAGGAGIPRVTLSNDSSLAANQSVNLNQVGAAALTLGQKTSPNSVPVTIASDQTLGLSVTDSATWTAASSAFTPAGGEYNPNAASLASGQQGTVGLTANRALKTAHVDSLGREVGGQVPGQQTVPFSVQVAPTFPPAPRLGTAAPITVNQAVGQALATPVVVALATGSRSSTGLQASIGCDRSVPISTAASGNTQLVGLVTGQSIYVCGFDWISTSALSVKFVYGTGSACGTGQADLEGAQAVAANGGKVIPVALPKWFLPAGQALCINLSGATQVSGSLTYTQF